ncbi:hypothetical protein ACI8AV_01730 [Geodermatophilus sp. SYSU D00804]
MSSARRSPSRRPRGHRALLVAGLVAAAVAVPGVATAAPGGPPADPLEGVVTTLEQAVTGQGGDAAEPPALPGTGALPLPGADQEVPAEPAPAEQGPVPPLPEALVQGLQSALTPLGVPEHCVQGVADGVQGLLDGVLSQDPAAAVEELVTGLQGALTGLASGRPPALDPATLGSAAEQVAADVEELIAAFQACLPALPETPEPPAPAPEPTPTPEAPHAAPVAAPVADQPVQYLGYAPTGGDEGVETEGPGAVVPLAALGGALLVGGGAGAAVSRARSRAVGR